MKRLRAFIAITPPPDFLEKVGKLQEKLKEKNLPVRWENPENLHITLLFLGHITQARMKTASKAVQKTAKNSRPFEVHADGLSYFYKRGADSVIYLDIEDPEKNFRNLYKALFNNLAEEDFYPPTRFTPHLSLGRLKKQRHEHDRKRMLQKAINVEFDSPGSFAVEKLEVFESIYSPGEDKQRHHLLKSFSLGKME